MVEKDALGTIWIISPSYCPSLISSHHISRAFCVCIVLHFFTSTPFWLLLPSLLGSGCAKDLSDSRISSPMQSLHSSFLLDIRQSWPLCSWMVLLRFTCCNILFPPAPLVTPLRDFSNYSSSIKQLSKNTWFFIPIFLSRSRSPFGTLPSPMASWTHQRLWLAYRHFRVKNVFQALDLYLHFQSLIWHFCQDISQLKPTPCISNWPHNLFAENMDYL